MTDAAGPALGGADATPAHFPSALSSVPESWSSERLPAVHERLTVLTDDELYTWLASRLPPAPPDQGGPGPFGQVGRVLDAGSATGVHTQLFADRYGEVLAVDTAAPMIAYARQQRPAANIRWQVRDLRDVTLTTDGQFDVVFSAYALHHIPGLFGAFRHLRSLVAPGGTLLVVDAVDDRLTVPRWWFVRQAWRGFAVEVLRGRRPAAEAVQLLRCRLNRDWLDYQTGSRLHPPDVWEDLAREVFPDADITSLCRARALSWRAPDPYTDLLAAPPPTATQNEDIPVTITPPDQTPGTVWS